MTKRVWYEIDTDTGRPIKPKGLDLIGQVVTIDGEVWVIANTDQLFPTDHVVVENSAGQLRSLAVERARELLDMARKGQ